MEEKTSIYFIQNHSSAEKKAAFNHNLARINRNFSIGCIIIDSIIHKKNPRLDYPRRDYDWIEMRARGM